MAQNAPPEHRDVTVVMTNEEYLNMRAFFDRIDIGRIQKLYPQVGIPAISRTITQLDDLTREKVADADGKVSFVMNSAAIETLANYLDHPNLAAFWEGMPNLTFRQVLNLGTSIFSALYRAVMPAVSAVPADQSAVVTTDSPVLPIHEALSESDTRPAASDAAAPVAADNPLRDKTMRVVSASGTLDA